MPFIYRAIFQLAATLAFSQHHRAYVQKQFDTFYYMTQLYLPAVVNQLRTKPVDVQCGPGKTGHPQLAVHEPLSRAQLTLPGPPSRSRVYDQGS